MKRVDEFMDRDPESEEWVDVGIEVELVGRNALKVAEEDPIFDTGDEIWIPYSQIKEHDRDDFIPGAVYSIEVPRWLAEEKGLI